MPPVYRSSTALPEYCLHTRCTAADLKQQSASSSNENPGCPGTCKSPKQAGWLHSLALSRPQAGTKGMECSKGTAEQEAWLSCQRAEPAGCVEGRARSSCAARPQPSLLLGGDVRGPDLSINVMLAGKLRCFPAGASAA